MMENGERVLGCCYAELSNDQYPDDYEYSGENEPNFPLNKGSGMVFAGLIGLMDPPRPDVPGAVKCCIDAGIKVIMVTGDHPETAQAIARQVHIIRDKVATRKDVAKARNLYDEFGNPDIAKVDQYDPDVKAIVIPGSQLAKMTPEDLDRALDFDQIVFARTSPKQKLDIVEALQRKEYVRRGCILKINH